MKTLISVSLLSLAAMTKVLFLEKSMGTMFRLQPFSRFSQHFLILKDLQS